MKNQISKFFNKCGGLQLLALALFSAEPATYAAKCSGNGGCYGGGNQARVYSSVPTGVQSVTLVKLLDSIEVCAVRGDSSQNITSFFDRVFELANNRKPTAKEKSEVWINERDYSAVFETIQDSDVDGILIFNGGVNLSTILGETNLQAGIFFRTYHTYSNVTMDDADARDTIMYYDLVPASIVKEGEIFDKSKDNSNGSIFRIRAQSMSPAIGRTGRLNPEATTLNGVQVIPGPSELRFVAESTNYATGLTISTSELVSCIQTQLAK